MLNIASFWDEQHWLPPGVTWADLEQFKKDGGRIPHLSDLWIVLPIAFLMILIRRLFEYTIGTPVANWLGIKVILLEKFSQKTYLIRMPEFRNRRNVKFWKIT